MTERSGNIEKVLTPCSKDHAKISELLWTCQGVYPMIVKRDSGSIGEDRKGILCVSRSEGGEFFNLCLWEDGIEDRERLIVRCSIHVPSKVQLRALAGQ